MSLLKPVNMTGLDTNHALFGNIKSFVELGVLDKELVSDTAVTTTAANATDADLGECRVFTQDSDVLSYNLSVEAGDTLVVIKRFNGPYRAGTSSQLWYTRTDGGDRLNVFENGYSTAQLSVFLRANYSAFHGHEFNPYEGTAQMPQLAAEVLVVPVSLDAPLTTHINNTAFTGSVSDDTITETDFSVVPLSVPLMSKTTAGSSSNVAAIILFDRTLTSTEITQISDNPWGLTDGTPAQTVALDAPLQIGAAFSGTYSFFSGIPTGPATISDGTRSMSVSVTITDNGDGTGTFSGTMPGLPASGSSAASGSLIYPNPTSDSISVTLTDPGA